ncbi:MAG TPA: 2OG-Fe(II) oxygenase family protein [Candidatus Nanoarchaeia archaeon]|nr:2OG-Fe(II) oxygenase family protein [Candidatus Nanoarchaeia archaeon]
MAASKTSHRVSFTTAKPFPYGVISNFLPKDKIHQLLSSLKQEPFSLKDSDLFTLWQTGELKENPAFSLLIEKFQSKEWKQQILEMTGIKISSKIYLFGSLYRKTNHLLPHDDRLEGRKIAFILFLNTLSEKEGGALQLFQRNKVAKKIYPQQGSLALFEVSEKSIHSIEEIHSGERWALTGWFYG